MDLLETLSQSRGEVRGQRLIIRDDQYEFSELQKILEEAARKKVSIGLVDSGKLDHLQIEILSCFPFSFYTSDSAREDLSGLSFLAEILRKKKRPVYLLLEKYLDGQEELFTDLKSFNSVIISSRERALDLDWLARLSKNTSTSGVTLVYYHHQNLEEKLAEISQKSTWIHVSNRNFSEDQKTMLLDLLKEMKKKKGHLVVHLDRAQSDHFLELLDRHGAFLIFNLPPVEFSSKLYHLEKRWRKKELPGEAYYLYPNLMT